MSYNVDLGKRAEKYVYFAYWCQEHKLHPRAIAECIELSIRYQRGYQRGGVSWYKLVAMLNQIKEKLYTAGAEDVKFKNGWPQFNSPIGERTGLPFKEFI